MAKSIKLQMVAVSQRYDGRSTRRSLWQFWSACTTSVLLHVTALGAIVGWAPSWPQPVVRRLFAGSSRTVSADSTWTVSQIAPPVPRVDRHDSIVVRPAEVQIERQRFVTESSHVVPTSRPEMQNSPSHDRALTIAELMLPEARARLEMIHDDAGAADPEPIETPVVQRTVSQQQPSSAFVSRSPNVARAAGTQVDRRAQLIDNRPPHYPETAQQRGWQGTVLLRLHIDATGTITQVDIVRSSGHVILDAEAVNAVHQWRAQPAERQGRAVVSEEILPVRFELP